MQCSWYMRGDSNQEFTPLEALVSRSSGKWETIIWSYISSVAVGLATTAHLTYQQLLDRSPLDSVQTVSLCTFQSADVEESIKFERVQRPDTLPSFCMAHVTWGRRFGLIGTSSGYSLCSIMCIMNIYSPRQLGLCLALPDSNQTELSNYHTSHVRDLFTQF